MRTSCAIENNPRDGNKGGVQQSARIDHRMTLGRIAQLITTRSGRPARHGGAAHDSKAAGTGSPRGLIPSAATKADPGP